MSVNCRVERKYDNNIYTISGCLRDFQRPFRSRDNNGHIYLVGFIIGNFFLHRLTETVFYMVLLVPKSVVRLLIILLFFHNFLCRLFSNMSCSLTLHWKICKSLIIPSWNICSHVDDGYENNNKHYSMSNQLVSFGFYREFLLSSFLLQNFFIFILYCMFSFISINIFNINVFLSTNNITSKLTSTLTYGNRILISSSQIKSIPSKYLLEIKRVDFILNCS